MSDYAIAVLPEPLVRRMREAAPGMRLAIEHLGPDARSPTGSCSTTTR